MKKILVIDDDADTIEIVRLALVGKFQVESWPGGRELSGLTNDFRPDLIIIDYFIGQQTAIDIIALLNSNGLNKNLPFILFSGHHDIKRLSGEIGASSYLEKPFTLAALRRCIEEVLTNPA